MVPSRPSYIQFRSLEQVPENELENVKKHKAHRRRRLRSKPVRAITPFEKMVRLYADAKDIKMFVAHLK